MFKKTKIATRPNKKNRDAMIKNGDIENTQGYQICKEILLGLSERITTEVVSMYEKYQYEKLHSEVEELFDQSSATIMSFEALKSIMFDKSSLNTSGYEDIEPMISDPDNYNRKVLYHVDRPSLPRSATELWDRTINKVKSASIMSRIDRKSIRKAPLKPPSFLLVDFTSINIRRINSIDQQLRTEKATAKLKAKMPKNTPKVSLQDRDDRCEEKEKW